MALPNFIQTVGARTNTEYHDEALPLAANTILRADGGRYMTSDGSGNYALSGAASVKLDAWAYTCYQPDHSGATSMTNITPFTGSASAGVSVAAGTKNIHIEDNTVWMPSADTLTAAMVDDEVDLVVTGSGSTTKQLLKPTVTTNKVVRILAVDVTNQLAQVYAIK